MAIFPGATYRPLNQFSDQGVKPRLGVVLHVNDSDAPSLYGWIAGNNDMSCHFQVADDGTIEQYIDTDNASWCQMAGNSKYLSIETQGYPGEALTAAQVVACAAIMRWVHATHGIPLQLADTVGAPGLAWHGMGGAAWGGHTGCPGDLRKAQRQLILTLAAAVTPTPGAPMTPAQEAKLDQIITVLGIEWRGDAVPAPTGNTHPKNLVRLFDNVTALQASVNQLLAALVPKP